MHQPHAPDQGHLAPGLSQCVRHSGLFPTGMNRAARAPAEMLPKGGSELDVRKKEADWVVMYWSTIGSVLLTSF
jgi:hypothetical protein